MIHETFLIALLMQQLLFNLTVGRRLISPLGNIGFIFVGLLILCLTDIDSYVVLIGYIYIFFVLSLYTHNFFVSITYILINFNLIQLSVIGALLVYFLENPQSIDLKLLIINFSIYIILLSIAYRVILKINIKLLMLKIKLWQKIAVFLFASIYLIVAWIQAYTHAITNIYWIYALLLAMLTGIFFRELYGLFELDSYKQKISRLEQTYIELDSTIKETQAFRHDYNNLLLSLAVLLKQGDSNQALYELQKLQKYSESYLRSSSYQKLENIKIPTVQGLLLLKLNEANSKNINIVLNVEGELTNLNINEFDYLRCLSIILDNAVEGSLTTTNPLIKIDIICTKNRISFKSTNNYDDHKKVALSQLMAQGFSTKKGHSGLGLNTLTKIVNQSTTTELSAVASESIFEITLVSLI